VNEPHAAVCGNQAGQVLNMVATDSNKSRNATVYLAGDRPDEVIKTIKRLNEMPPDGLRLLNLPAAHPVPRAARLEKILSRLYDLKPASFEEILAVEGVGPATVRAFALVGEVIYGVKPSHEDPVRYSY